MHKTNLLSIFAIPCPVRRQNSYDETQLQPTTPAVLKSILKISS